MLAPNVYLLLESCTEIQGGRKKAKSVMSSNDSKYYEDKVDQELLS